MAKPELFENNFYAWLEANGFTFVQEALPKPPARLFVGVFSMEQLKAGILQLIESSSINLSEVRDAVEKHEGDGYLQWFVSEYAIDCDAEEFWKVVGKVFDAKP